MGSVDSVVPLPSSSLVTLYVRMCLHVPSILCGRLNCEKTTAYRKGWWLDGAVGERSGNAREPFLTEGLEVGEG